MMVSNRTTPQPDAMKREAVYRLLAWRFPPEEIAATLGLPVQTVLDLQASRAHTRRAEETDWMSPSGPNRPPTPSSTQAPADL